MLALVSVAAAGGLATGIDPAARPIPRTSGAIFAVTDPMALVVAPGAASLRPGDTISLNATWTGVPVDCTLGSGWFSWSFTGAPVAQIVGAFDGPTVTLVGDASAPGAEVASVRAAVTVACPSGVETLERVANATLSGNLPLALLSLSVGPNPVPPGATVVVRGTVGGGLPPYRVEVDWRNGDTSNAVVGPNGSFALSTTDPPGRSDPTLTCSDAAGDELRVTVPTPVVSSAGPAVAIDGPDRGVAAGSAAPFRAVVSGVFGDVSYAWAVNGRRVAGANTSAWTLPTRSPGLVNVSVDVEAPFGLVASYFDLVVGAPITLRPLPLSEVVGASATTTTSYLELRGGVPPLVASGPDFSATVDGPGLLAFPWPRSLPDPGMVDVRVRDSENGSAAAAFARPVPSPSPDLALTGFAEGTNGTWQFGVDVRISGGSPPFDLTIRSDPPPTVFGATAVALGSARSWFGAGRFAPATGVTFTVEVVDGVGATNASSIVAYADPPLRTAFDLEVGTGNISPVIAFVGTVYGGDPPYTISITVGGSESWTASDPAPGLVEYDVPTNGSGPVDVAWVVRDSANQSTGGSAIVVVPAGVPGATAGGNELVVDLLLAGLIVAALGGAVALRVRRRESSGRPRRAGDVPAVIRTLAGEPAGLERELLEALAVDQGLPSDAVRREVDRMIEDGRLQKVESTDGVDRWRIAPPIGPGSGARP